MIRAVKIRLLPTKEQENQMFKQVGCARFAYNFMLTYCNEYYKKGEKKTPVQARDVLTGVKDIAYPFLKEVSADSFRNTSQDLQKAFHNFFKGLANYPKTKNRKSKQSFYHNDRKLQVEKKRVRLEKIGWVKMKSDQAIPLGHYKKDKIKVTNPRISYDNKAWHLTFGVESATSLLKTNQNTMIGIDLGIKTFATLSTGKKYKNINKSPKVRLLKQRYKRLSRAISRKYESNKEYKKYIKTKNILKLEQKRRLLDRKLTNIRNNYLHRITKDIVNLRPCKVVVETLNIKGMMKNKRLSKSIRECKFYDFQRQLEYKLPNYLGITLTKVPLFYPSSKLCSDCGYKYSNKDYSKPWSLGIRKWTCIKCNTMHDRDRNASLNLASYRM